jgi:hypothetical protein
MGYTNTSAVALSQLFVTIFADPSSKAGLNCWTVFADGHCGPKEDLWKVHLHQKMII